MGVPHAQIIGTYGERCTSGSNLNGAYGNGNLWDANGALDHNAAAHDPSHWPTDPLSADEAAMIAQSTEERAPAPPTSRPQVLPREPNLLA